VSLELISENRFHGEVAEYYAISEQFLPYRSEHEVFKLLDNQKHILHSFVILPNGVAQVKRMIDTFFRQRAVAPGVRVAFAALLRDTLLGDGSHKHSFFTELCPIIVPALQEAATTENGTLFTSVVGFLTAIAIADESGEYFTMTVRTLVDCVGNTVQSLTYAFNHHPLAHGVDID